MFSIKTYNGQSESGVEDEENATTISALRHEDVIKSFCTGVNQPIYLVYVTQTLYVYKFIVSFPEHQEIQFKIG